LAKGLNPLIQVESVVGDLKSEELVKEAVSRAITLFGGLNYAVNAAGITGNVLPTHEMSFEDYKNVQQVNLEGLWICEREELKAMLLSQDPIDGYVKNPMR
jgi:NAD(P)-dependent dehydrogenase (short-subunit alcohol dehydrogenase family)